MNMHTSIVCDEVSGVAFLDAKLHHCRFVISPSHLRGLDVRFCGAFAPDPKSRWCEAHRKVVFRSVKAMDGGKP